MLLGEPAPSQGDLHFALFGIPVRVSPMFWLVAALLKINSNTRDLVPVLLWIIALFVSVLVHEMGHALVIRSYGQQPWITLYGMGGLASYSTRLAPERHILVSLAGPGAGFVLAALVVTALRLSGHPVQFFFGGPGMIAWDFADLANHRLQSLVDDLLFANIFYGLLNLLPIYPLDGGQVTREVFNLYRPRTALRESLTLSMFAAGGLAAYVGLQMHDLFLVLFFGYLAYMNYQALEGYFGPGGGWGGRR